MKNDRRAQRHLSVATAVKAGATAARPTTAVPGASTCTCGGGRSTAQ